MHGTQAILATLKSTAGLPGWYLGDMTDADLLVRPTPGANHIAWQFGHLIDSEPHLVKMVLPDAKFPAFPAGFSEMHNKEASKKDSGFLTKSAYLELFGAVREASMAAAAKLSDADLDKPTTGNMAQFAPNWGTLMILVSNHVLMHIGQFTVVRRKLGKPVLF